jgi:hypothetical protein
MKNIILLVALLFTVNITNAQIATFNSSSAKEKIDETNVKYTFTVDGLKISHEEMLNKFKSASGVKKVTNNGSEYSIIVGKSNSKKTMQSILLESGINQVIIDGKELKTSELAEYYREQKAAK